MYWLVIANLYTKANSGFPLCRCLRNDNGLSQLIVDIVSAVLDGHGAVVLPAGHHGDGFAAVAAKGEQERIKFFIIGFDALDDVLLTFRRTC